MPVNMSGAHWCLIIADMKHKLCQCYDPLNLGTSDKYMTQFLDSLRVRNSESSEEIDNTGWKSTKLKDVPGQQDGWNCGVYIILYAALHISSITLSDFHGVQSFRMFLAEKLIKECPSMRHLCLKCGKDEYNVLKGEFSCMIQCKSCLRWMHMRHFHETENINVDADYTCFVCLSV